MSTRQRASDRMTNRCKGWNPSSCRERAPPSLGHAASPAGLAGKHLQEGAQGFAFLTGPLGNAGADGPEAFYFVFTSAPHVKASCPRSPSGEAPAFLLWFGCGLSSQGAHVLEAWSLVWPCQEVVEP